MTKPHRLLTFNGRLIDPLNPEDDDFDIEDIAHALAMTNFFGGGSQGFYSHAQHAFYRSHMAQADVSMAALLYFAPSIYWEFPFVSGEPDADTKDEGPLAGHLALSFGLAVDALEDPYLQLVDDRLQALAAGILLKNPTPFWASIGGSPDGSIFDVDRTFKCWPWEMAKKLFLSRYFELRNRV